jgi:hypothetical protein
VNSRAKAIVDFATSYEELPNPDEAKTPRRLLLGAKEVHRAGRLGRTRLLLLVGRK